MAADLDRRDPSAAVEARELLSRILAAWGAQHAPSTRRAYHGDLRAFAAFLGLERRPGKPDPEGAAAWLLTAGPVVGREQALAWVAEQREEEISPTTINRRLSALRSLVAEAGIWFEQVGRPAWTLRVKGEKAEPYRETAGPSPAAIESVIAALDPAHPTEARDRLAISLMYDLGLRRSSVASIQRKHVNLTAGTVSVRLKGDRQRKAKRMTARLAAAMTVALEAHGDSLFPLGSASTIARITHGHGLGNPHGLRHSAATLIATRTGNVYAVQAFLDHASPDTSKYYVDNAADLSGQAARIVAGEADALE